MKITLKDVRTVSAMVDFITDLQDYDPCLQVSSSNRSRAISRTSRTLLTDDVKSFLRKVTKKYFRLQKGVLEDGLIYENFNQLSISLERRLLQKSFSTVAFLKYCCQVCVLALQASFRGLKPAPRLAEFYILRTIKKFRSKVQFSNDSWRCMSFIVEKYLKDGSLQT